MRVHVAPSPASAGPGHALSTFLIDDTLAIDAGALGISWSPVKLAKVRDVFLTHTHIDHVAGLPIFLDTYYGLGPPPVIHGLPATLQSLRDDLFNDRLFPDFVRLSTILPPFLILNEVTPGVPTQRGPFTITPFLVDHPVPTASYLIDDGHTVLAIITDTAAVPDVYARIAAIPRLGAIFLECAFPNEQAQLAQVSKHLTPSLFAEAAAVFPDSVPIYVIHIKPRFYDSVCAELRDAGLLGRCSIAEPGSIIEILPRGSHSQARTAV